MGNDKISDIFISALKKEIEKHRLTGIIQGLEIGIKAWDKGLGREGMFQDKIYFSEELEKLNSTEK